MNRYIAEGIMADVLDGKRIMIVAQNLDVARNCFTTTQQTAQRWPEVDEQLISIRSGRGAERMTSSNGGRVDVCAANVSLRGRGIDVMVILGYRGMTDRQQREVIDACIHTKCEQIRDD